MMLSKHTRAACIGLVIACIIVKLVTMLLP